MTIKMYTNLFFTFHFKIIILIYSLHLCIQLCFTRSYWNPKQQEFPFTLHRGFTRIISLKIFTFRISVSSRFSQNNNKHLIWKQSTYPSQMFERVFPVEFLQPSAWSQFISLQLHVDLQYFPNEGKTHLVSQFLPE